jgi:hypothetical protein
LPGDGTEGACRSIRKRLQYTAVMHAAGIHIRIAEPPIVSAPIQNAAAARWNTWP